MSGLADARRVGPSRNMVGFGNTESTEITEKAPQREYDVERAEND